MALSAKDLEIKQLTEDFGVTNKISSGRMSSNILFNSASREYIKGNFNIKNGALNLGLLGDAINLEALKEVNFDKISGVFGFSKDTINMYKMRLRNPQMSIEAFWSLDKKINGELDLVLASELLKESAGFKKILSIARVKKPFIDLKFRLGGIQRK